MQDNMSGAIIEINVSILSQVVVEPAADNRHDTLPGAEDGAGADLAQ